MVLRIIFTVILINVTCTLILLVVLMFSLLISLLLVRFRLLYLSTCQKMVKLVVKVQNEIHVIHAMSHTVR